jgi:hypothetical protein
MAKELPYFKFTLQEWQNGAITDMPDSAQGVFINVCCYYWANNCEVTDKMLLKRFKTKTKTIQKLIKSEVIKNQNGIIMVSFLDKQLLELNKNHSFFSECGKKGQKVKKQKAPLKPPLKSKTSYKNIKDKNIKDKEVYRKFAHLFLTVDEFNKLKESYSVESIDSILDEIENYKGNKKYVSLYLTANNWLKKGNGKQPEINNREVIKQQMNTELKRLDKIPTDTLKSKILDNTGTSVQSFNYFCDNYDISKVKNVLKFLKEYA